MEGHALDLGVLSRRLETPARCVLDEAAPSALWATRFAPPNGSHAIGPATFSIKAKTVSKARQVRLLG